MPRIAGNDIPEKENIDLSLTRVYGIGPNNVTDILEKVGIKKNKRVKDLTEKEIASLNRAVRNVKTEGDLRQEVHMNIARHKQIGSYRGKRHAAGLPVRGQQTRTNARTNRGKRKTVGALNKKAFAGVDKDSKKDNEKTK